MKQKTISKSFCLSGIGLHSGSPSQLLFYPAASQSGICFIKHEKKIPARVENVRETRRGTSLDGISVTEHLLAALYAAGIDNLEIEIKGEELPALDGSALPFLEALFAAGITEQNELKEPIHIQQPIKVVEAESSLEVLPSRGFKIDFMVNFAGAGEQRCIFDFQSGNFKQEIAPARTFGYLEEYELLKQKGLARGASFENALVLGKDGYINTPRFPDEVVRHKILDLVGDLALLGRPLQAEIKAIKSGHKLNIELARQILKEDLKNGRIRH